MNKANNAILFSALMSTVLASRPLIWGGSGGVAHAGNSQRTAECPLDMDPSDITCSNYNGPCLLEPIYCCGEFIGYGGEAYCTEGDGWNFRPLEQPLCPEACPPRLARGARGKWSESHEGTTDTSHNKDTWGSDVWDHNGAFKKEGSHETWFDGATDSWKSSNPWGETTTRDTTSEHGKAKWNEDIWEDDRLGTRWSSDNGESFHKKLTDSTTFDNGLWKEWEDKEATKWGDKSESKWGEKTPSFTHTGSESEINEGESSSHKWGTKGNGWSEEGSHTKEDKFHHSKNEEEFTNAHGTHSHSHEHKATSSKEAKNHSVVGPNGTTTHSSSSSSSSTSTKTSSSSSTWGRRRAALADRLAQAEDADVEPTLGDYVTELLTPAL